MQTAQNGVLAAGASTILGSMTGAQTSRMIRACAVLAVTALTALAAQVSVPLPFTEVPFTLQPMVVLLGGAALGARLGCASQGLYLLLGLVGLPVFAATPLLPQGPARLMGPTAGFLLSYPLAAFVTGWLAERRFDRQYLTSFVAMASGLGILFAGGLSWYAWGLPSLGAGRALALAVAFLPADLLKVAIAAGVLPAVWRFLGSQPQ